MNYLKINNLSIGYTHPLISNINFSIDSGDLIKLFGTNGSGKTTFIKTLLGIVKPIDGEINYFIDRKDISYVPQENNIPRNFPSTVMEIVLSSFASKSKYIPFYSKEEKSRVLDALKIMKIDHLAKMSFGELSGGQRQRVLIARSLCSDSKLIIMDEPSNSLDKEGAKELAEIITYLNAEKKITMLIISHSEALDIKFNKFIQFNKGDVSYV